MADPRYSIDWTPPDIGPGASLIASVLNQNRTQARADEYVGMQREGMRRSAERESHEMKRQADNEAHRRAVEAYNALPTLMRAAHRSPEMANANPFGVRFETEQAPPPSIADVDIMGAKDGQYAKHAAQALMGAPTPDARTLGAAESGREFTWKEQGMRGVMPDGTTQDMEGVPPGEVVRVDAVPLGQPPADNALEAPADDEPSPGITAAHALLGAPRPRKMFATFQGQRFEVPEQSETTGFGEKYDAIYQRALQEPGVDPEEAYRFVAKRDHDDTTEAGKNERLKQTLGFKGTNREDQQAFLAGENEKYRSEGLSFDQRGQLIDRAGKWRLAAAATEKPSAADSGEANIAKTFQADFKDFRDRTSNSLAEIRATRNVHEIQKLANSTNPVDQALAVEQIGKIAHGGNTVTKATQDLIYHHMGGAFERGEAALKQYTDSGRMADSQLKMLRDTAAGLAQHHGENKHAIEKGFELQFGPNSMYGDPYVQPMARQHLDALYTQMGIPTGRVEAPQTEGSIRLGRNRGKKTGASPARQSQAAGSSQVAAAKKWLADNPKADPGLRAKVEAKIKALEGGH